MTHRITGEYTIAGIPLPEVQMTYEQVVAWVDGYMTGWNRGYLAGYEGGELEEAAALRAMLDGLQARDRVLRERGDLP